MSEGNAEKTIVSKPTVKIEVSEQVQQPQNPPVPENQRRIKFTSEQIAEFNRRAKEKLKQEEESQ